LIVRSGVLPDPANVSAIQYAKVTQEFHLHWYQVALFALLVLAVVAIVAVNLRGRYGGMRASRADAWRGRMGLLIAGSAALLVFSVTPDQFYGLTAEGRRLPASIGGMVPLYIRNTLLVSGTTGLLAVALATPAGYAFSRLRF